MFNSDTVFLVVDDFEPMRKITANQLRSLGANNILTAPNGLEALRIINSQRVDVVLSDWNMPVMTGLELLKALRTDPKLERLPFIMITAEAERTHIQQAIAHGVTDLLIKPYSPARLANRIEKAMSARTQNRPPRILPQPVSDPAKGGAHSEVEAATLQRLYKGKANAHERPSILIVDDTPDNLMLLSNLFKNEYRIHLAINGEKALKMCQSDAPPDLVLLDVMMPDMDGFEVLQKLREHPMSEGIPVIFVTAVTDPDARSKGLELGAVDYVTKPVDPATLKLRVRNFMRYIGLHKQLQASYDDMLEMAHLREDIEHITRHDLKAPLAGVIGIVRAMLGDGTASHTQGEQLRAIEQTTLEVMNMINLSSELFKIETHRFELHAQKVDIADLLQRTTALLGTTFASKQLHLALQQSAPPVVWGDATLCYSLFNNLLKNAFEAAPDHTTLTVMLAAEGEHCRISIQNRGVVPPEIRARFFDKFITSGKQGGTGLGTYSAKLLTEAQHGQISMEVSDIDNLTTVTVTLPATPPATTPAPAPATAAPAT
jgi:two-component system, sensor histidine kinase and response regulator